jgi:hypothetical protein
LGDRRGGGALLLLVTACGLLIAGCGEGEGVASGATVNVYASASSCAEAKGVVEKEGGRAGDVKVRVLCLADAERGGRLDLATIGANARRAAQDSTTVAYIGEKSQEAVRFSRPIVEEGADIAVVSGLSGTAAMKQIMSSIEDAGSSSNLREAVLDDLR